MTDWVITLPKTVEWEDYEKELDLVKNWGHVMNYRVARYPLDLKHGDRCFLVWRGMVRGWMQISGFFRYPEGFMCSTTQTQWKAGNYIQRSGPFHWITPVEMRGFQGIRRMRITI